MAESQLRTSEKPAASHETEDWGDEEEGYEEEEDEDIDAEAEEIARRLGEELWADINKAQADRAGVAPSKNSLSSRPVTTTSSSQNNSSQKDESVILTMKAILAYVKNDTLAHSTLASTVVPETGGQNILDILNRAIATGTVPREVAMPLSHTLVTLARSKALFGTLRHSNAPLIQLDRGKRKREQTDDGRAYRRPFMPNYDLQTEVTEAVRAVAQALGSTSPGHTLDPSLIASIQLQLHQVFLFAVTSSAGGGPEMNALQEIGGLIQVLGVLSGIHIGPTNLSDTLSARHQPPRPRSFPKNTNPSTPWLPSTDPTTAQSVQVTDIGTAVYPCLIAGCRKMFSRLYTLRAHQRIHALHRPFRCTACPASFARNHDLKRHSKLHDRKAWKCCGCGKMFSRRDAIKRHKDGSMTRKVKRAACADAEVQEVDLDDQGGEEVVREERRAKIWNGIAGSHGSGVSEAAVPERDHEDTNMEEGEVQTTVISGIQSAVMSLHGLLQGHVANALGTPPGQAISSPLDPTGGQATLASVIARAQLQSQSLKVANDSQPPSSSTTSRSAAPPTTSDATRSPSSPQPHSLNDNIVNQSSEDRAIAATPSLSVYGLSDEQTKMLEQAIANAASAAQAQAEAEAALEEEEEDGYDQDEEEYAGSEGQPDAADSASPTG